MTKKKPKPKREPKPPEVKSPSRPLRSWMMAAMCEAVRMYPPGLAATHREAWILTHVAANAGLSYDEIMGIVRGEVIDAAAQ